MTTEQTTTRTRLVTAPTLDELTSRKAALFTAKEEAWKVQCNWTREEGATYEECEALLNEALLLESEYSQVCREIEARYIFNRITVHQHLDGAQVDDGTETEPVEVFSYLY